MRTCVCVCVRARSFVHISARVCLNLGNALLLLLIELLLESQLLLLPLYFAQNLSKHENRNKINEKPSAREPASSFSASFYASLITQKNQKRHGQKNLSKSDAPALNFVHLLAL